MVKRRKGHYLTEGQAYVTNVSKEIASFIIS